MRDIQEQILAKIAAGQNVTSTEIAAIGGYEAFDKLVKDGLPPAPNTKPADPKSGDTEEDELPPSWERAKNIAVVLGGLAFTHWIAFLIGIMVS